MNTENAVKMKRILRNPYNRRRLLLFCGSAVLVLALIVLGAVLLTRQARTEDTYRVLDGAQIAEAAGAAGEIADETRETVVRSALSLVGRVRYFWGGKSSATDADPLWGTLMEVKSSGSESSGTLRPYGLDCSGYVSWCFIQTGMGWDSVVSSIGNGTWNQWDKSEPISFDEMQPGDLAFTEEYPGASGNHVGICIGYGADGEPAIAHCSSSLNDVVVTTLGDVFRYARRPLYYARGESDADIVIQNVS